MVGCDEAAREVHLSARLQERSMLARGCSTTPMSAECHIITSIHQCLFILCEQRQRKGEGTRGIGISTYGLQLMMMLSMGETKWMAIRPVVETSSESGRVAYYL